jgi:hypothetical protein
MLVEVLFIGVLASMTFMVLDAFRALLIVDSPFFRV